MLPIGIANEFLSHECNAHFHCLESQRAFTEQRKSWIVVAIGSGPLWGRIHKRNHRQS